MTAVPDRKLDANIVGLVNALNAFRTIITLGSCGGHKQPEPGQLPEGSWYVTFKVELSREGWLTLEFLSWLINKEVRNAGGEVLLYPCAPPPYRARPGEGLHFRLEAQGVAPADVAALISERRPDSL